jgi:hypothetical protein
MCNKGGSPSLFSFDMEPKPVSRPVQQGADEDFGPGVPSPDLRHVPASLLLGQPIRHWPRSPFIGRIACAAGKFHSGLRTS